MSALPLPSSIRLVEVGLRDGLQSVPEFLPTAEKVAIVEMLIDAGVREIEAVSFAHPKLLPQLSDAAEVMAAVPRDPSVIYRGLVPNLRGAARAVDCGVDRMMLVVSADEEVSTRNQNRTVEQMITETHAVGDLAKSSNTGFIVGVACAFFAPARGPVSRTEMMRIVDEAVAAGADAVYLAGTSGQEHPREIADGITAVTTKYPTLDVGVHLHNRNGFAPANALAAMMAGASWLEGSFGGLGGDLWFPGDPSVLGNAPLEDLVHLCDSMGVTTGIDLLRYLPIAERIAKLTGRPSASFVSRGGTRDNLASASWPLV